MQVDLLVIFFFFEFFFWRGFFFFLVFRLFLFCPSISPLSLVSVDYIGCGQRLERRDQALNSRLTN